MSDTTTDPKPAPAQPAQPDQQPKPQPPAAVETTTEPQRDAADLGEAGKKAIQAERQRAEAAERELKGFRSQLLKAFGVEQDKGGEDIVSTLQQRISNMEKTNLVNEVARRHGITEDDDIALLRNQPDEQGMALLASRLRSTTPAAPPAPAPDPSQGSAPLSPEAAEQAAYEAFFPSR